MPTCIHVNTAGINQMRHSGEQSCRLICMRGGAGAAALIAAGDASPPLNTAATGRRVMRSCVDRTGTGALNLINRPEAGVRRQRRSSYRHGSLEIRAGEGGGGGARRTAFHGERERRGGQVKSATLRSASRRLSLPFFIQK